MMERNPRRVAWEFLRDVERDDAYVNLVLQKVYPELDRRDRPFFTEIVLGSVRMRKRLDHIINLLSDREVDHQTRSLLRLAFYELIFMDTADHAVGNEYVELSKRVIGRSRSGFINALLRRAVRERDSILTEDGLDLATKTSHPEWIVNAYKAHFAGEALLAELRSHNEAPTVHAVSFLPLDPEFAEKSDVTPYGFRLKGTTSDIPALSRGSAFVQDEGSQIICEIALATDPMREKSWLDLCAGPGGKFAYLAHFLKPDQLKGNELHPHRADLIRRRTPTHEVFVGDGRELSNGDERYDRILIDAPCTGIGALRRKADARWRRRESDLKGLIGLQRELLDSAARMLKNDGLLFYVTCSPHLLETKAQVEDFLHRNNNFEVEPLPSEGLPQLVAQIVERAKRADGSLQLFTGRDGTDAMFMTILRKVG